MKAPVKLALAAVAASVLAVAACSSEEAAAPSRPPTPPPATTVDGGSSGTTGDGGSSGSTCFDTDAGKPTEPAHFLNQCNGTECFKFDNAARIEGFAPGPLPPLN